MKKLSKRSKLILGIVSVILLFFGYYSYRTCFWEQNVFNQMYYSRVHKNTEFSQVASFFGYYRKLFKDMPQLSKKDYDEDYDSIEFCYTVEEQYNETFLKDGHRIRLKFLVNEPTMFISYRIETEDVQEWYSYCYNVDQKTLTYETSDPENTEMKNFLFDRVLSDWFAANKWRTRFSIENLGEYTLIDTTE